MDNETIGIPGFSGAVVLPASVSAAAPKWAAKGSTIEKCGGVAPYSCIA